MPTTISREQALRALKKADWFGLSWGHRAEDGTDQFCAAAWLLIEQHGPEAFELRGEVWFPTAARLPEARDALGQLANWAEVFGFIRRRHYDIQITDVYVFDQKRVTDKARLEP